jgi:hypothetical protein
MDGDGQFSSPQGVVTDAQGNVYVADTWNNRVQKFGDRIAPTVVQVSPSDGATGVSRGINVTATFSEPMRATTINKSTFSYSTRSGRPYP